VVLAGKYGRAVWAWLDPARRKLRQRGLPAIDDGFLNSLRLDTDAKQARYARLRRQFRGSSWPRLPAR
jgi:chitin disaccharide deacetylase